jgi:2-dehydro-3-deoxygluconokinase
MSGSGFEVLGSGPVGFELVGFGEAMLLLTAADAEPLETTRLAELHVAGAELNVCAAAARLGARTAFASRIGDDPFGRRVHAACAQLGVATSLLAICPTAPTGVFFKDVRPDGERRVHYYRAGSAASTMDSTDADRVLATNAGTVIVSGITASLSPTASAAVTRLLSSAQAAGVRIALDPNLRPGLRPVDDQVALLRPLLPDVDTLLLGLDEGEYLFGVSTPGEVVEAALRAGVGEVVVKLGAEGCAVADGPSLIHLPSAATTVVDPVGAGDAFAGGYLVGRSRGLTPVQAARLGSELAARVVATRGDTDGLPSAEQAVVLLAQASTTTNDLRLHR